MNPPATALARRGSTDPDHPLLVLGNSLGTDHTMWDLVIDRLPENLRIVIWDLPGHGDSEPATEPFTIGDLTDAVLDAVGTEFGTDTPWVYAGDSVSGQVGFEIASRNLSHVRAVIPVCSAPRIGTPDSWSERAALVRAQGLEPLVEGTRERWFGPGFVQEHTEVAKDMLTRLTTVDPESYALVCDALGRFDAWSALGDTLTRVHLVLGTADAAVPLERAREVAQQAGHAVVTELEGVGHQAPVERPAETAAVIVRELGL